MKIENKTIRDYCIGHIDLRRCERCSTCKDDGANVKCPYYKPVKMLEIIATKEDRGNA